MAITLHAVSARHLHGAFATAVTVAILVGLVGWRRLGYGLSVTLAWDVGVLAFTALVLAMTTRYDETRMAQKARHRAPGTGVLALAASCAAGFGIYAIALLLGAGDGLSQGQVGQRPFDMGYKAMFILQELNQGKKVQDPIYTGLDVCTPQNQATCLAK